MEKVNNCQVPATKVLSKDNEDRTKDMLRAIFVHKELWNEHGYPKSTTIRKKWNLLLNHPALKNYVETNEGTNLTIFIYCRNT